MVIQILEGFFCYNASSSPVLTIPVVQQVEERSTLDSGVQLGNSSLVRSNPAKNNLNVMGDTKTQCRDNQLPENLNHHIHAFTDIWPWALACQVLAKVNCNSNSVISVMTKLMGVKSYSTRVNILKRWVLRAEGSRKVDERQPHA